MAMSCPNCANPTLPHTICKKCGFYKGKQVITIKKAKEEAHEHVK
jgi:large subunit ribosomal protein L32